MTVPTLKTVEVRLKVEGVNPKSNEKFKTAGGLFLGKINGKDTWVNVATGVDMSQFKVGQVNIVKQLVRENGEKGNIVEFIGLGDGGNISSTSSARSHRYVDNSKGQRLGGLGHDIAEVASALIVANGFTFEQFIELYPKVRDFLTKQRNQMEAADK